MNLAEVKLLGNYVKKKIYIKVGFIPAFTMVELVFVIVVLGILSAVAIPKLAATRDDAVIVKGKSQVSAIRSGIAMQKAKALLQGDNSGLYNNKFRLTRLDGVTSGFGVAGSRLFNFADGNESNVLENPIFSKTTGTGGWTKENNTTYTFKMTNSVDINFTYNSTTGIFGCDTGNQDCLTLTQ